MIVTALMASAALVAPVQSTAVDVAPVAKTAVSVTSDTPSTDRITDRGIHIKDQGLMKGMRITDR